MNRNMSTASVRNAALFQWSGTEDEVWAGKGLEIPEIYRHSQWISVSDMFKITNMISITQLHLVIAAYDTVPTPLLSFKTQGSASGPLSRKTVGPPPGIFVTCLRNIFLLGDFPATILLRKTDGEIAVGRLNMMVFYLGTDILSQKVLFYGGLPCLW